MLSNINFVYVSESGLESVEYSFWFDDYTLWLDSYIEFARLTKRHSFKPVRLYLRLDKRKSNMSLEDVNLSDNIKQAAIQEVVNRLKVKTWDK